MLFRTFVLALSLTLPMLFPAAAQDESGGLDALTCKQVMIRSGLDRATTIAFIHGYLSHKRGDNIIDLEALEAANVIFLDQCLDHPAAMAIETMEAAFAN